MGHSVHLVIETLTEVHGMILIDSHVTAGVIMGGVFRGYVEELTSRHCQTLFVFKYCHPLVFFVAMVTHCILLMMIT